jgi:diguanylate cyclase (GGDEF)-like protein/PAS domain S-box-containing protein
MLSPKTVFPVAPEHSFSDDGAVVSALDGIKALAQFGPDGILQHANRLYLSIFGCELDDVRGAHHRVFCDPAYVDSPAYGAFWERLRTGHAYTDLCERRRRDGSTCWLEVTYAPIRDADDQVLRILKMASDVTERVTRERHALEDARRLSLVADSTDNATLITDGEWRIIYVNRGFTRMFGWKLEDVVGQVPPRLMAPHVTDAHIAVELELLKSGSTLHLDELLSGAHGERYWCSIATSPVRNEQGQLINTCTVIADITDAKMHQVLQHRVLEAVASDQPLSSVATMICEEVDRILPDVATCIVESHDQGRMNPLAAPRLPTAYLKYLAAHSVGQDMLCSSEGAPVVPTGSVYIDITVDERWAHFRGELTALGYEAFWMQPILSASGGVMGAVVFHYRERRALDEFHRRLMNACVQLCALGLERERSKARIHRLAFYDPVTRLANRSLLGAKAEQVFAAASRSATSAAVVFVDLDRFKQVNDSLGHPIGDELLRVVAGRLSADRRAMDIVCRLSGDQFVMVLPECDARDAAEAVERTHLRLHEAVEIGGTQLRPSASYGIAMYPADGGDIETLLRLADLAMYQAKTAARGSCKFFSGEMNAQAQARLALENELRDAIFGNALELHYQPQVELATGRLHGVEALSRWTSPLRGPVSPVEFIPVAEACNLIGDLTQWLLRTACSQLARWRAAGVDVPMISVNLSPISFHDIAMPKLIADTLREHGLQPVDLMVEITEGVLLEQHPTPLRTIHELTAMGVRLSMDDFGTGYSSLSYLHSLPISELKLDRSFVGDLGIRDSALPLSRAVVQIGMSLGLTVVAEGVETELQRSLLAEQGCHVAQGYFFGRPMPAARFEEWLRERAAG